MPARGAGQAVQMVHSPDNRIVRRGGYAVAQHRLARCVGKVRQGQGKRKVPAQRSVVVHRPMGPVVASLARQRLPGSNPGNGVRLHGC